MSAPSSEFLSNPIGTMKDSATANCSVGVYDATVAVLKTRYYLDFVLGVAEYNASGAEVAGKTGFIGGCFVGSSNYYMHNRSRDWVVGSLTANNEVLFNDAGKNTLTRISNIGDMPVVVNSDIGILEVSALFLTAWHVDTSQHGFRFTPIPGFSDAVTNLGFMAQRTTASKTGRVDISSQTALKAGDTLNVTAFVQNAEGLWTSQSRSFTITPRLVSMKYNLQYASSAYNGIDVRNIYVGTSEIRVGTNFYSNAQMTEANLPANGYYTVEGFWYQVSYVTELSVTYARVVATGTTSASGWPPTDPAYDSGARVMQQAYYNSGGFEAPCTSWNQGNLPNRTIWKSTFNNVYYTQEVGGDIVANGWYVWGGIWHNMAGGMISGTGSCPTGG